jgi:hypothetical protein
MWWGNDISKCPGNDCPYKEKCYRYTVKADRFQSYSDFTQLLESGKRCEYYLSNEDRMA